MGGPADAPEGRTILKVEKPKIFHIAKYPPPIGSRVKIWFDMKERQLTIEDETGRVTWDIYGVLLSDVVFDTELTPRGAVRCVARGNIIAIPSTSGYTETSHNIIKEAGRSMEFYWSRDKQWPFAGARLALISPPQGGFPTSYAVDPVPKP
jgi:hypothetical protein